MSLLNTVTRTLKGLLNDAADSVQDPSRDSRQIVRELDESIAKAENSLIEIQAQVATQQSTRRTGNRRNGTRCAGARTLDARAVGRSVEEPDRRYAWPSQRPRFTLE